jgi:iron complex transport system substrate-binding protein
VLVYANTGTGGWSPGARTTSDTMIRLAGMINAAAEAGLERHAKVDFERFLAIDPDVIVVNELATGEESATRGVVASAPALAGLRAVQDDRILVLPPDLMAADSPLIVAAAERLAAEVDRMVADGLAPR